VFRGFPLGRGRCRAPEKRALQDAHRQAILKGEAGYETLQTIDVPASRAVVTNVSLVAWRPRCGSGDGGVFESTNGRELVEPRREESNLGDLDSPSRGGRRHRRL
jgi:hypothetical protein